MDHRGRESCHLMLITPERVFYAGLLGRPRERCPGAFHVYVAIKGGLWLTTADGRESYRELVAVSPNERHTLASDYCSAICLVIEPESVGSPLSCIQSLDTVPADSGVVKFETVMLPSPLLPTVSTPVRFMLDPAPSTVAVP